MKKLLVITNLLFVGIIIGISCQKKTGPLDICELTGTKTFTYLLDTSLLYEMTDKYKLTVNLNKITNKAMAGRKDTMADDSRAIWFSLKRLKGFIAEIEGGLCGRNCGELNPGIRMYYSRYPYPGNYANLQGIPDSFENRHTLFMVPTYDDNATSDHIDFDPRYFIGNTCTPEPLAKVFSSDFQSKVQTPGTAFALAQNAIAKQPQSNQQSMNHGDLIPPPYNNSQVRTMAYFLK